MVKKKLAVPIGLISFSLIAIDAQAYAKLTAANPATNAVVVTQSVNWHVASEDTHDMDGMHSFTVKP